jgi:dTDP-4-dehydrorhamnose reductase
MIFGAKGQLGRDLMRVFGGSAEVKGFDLPEVDITDEEALYPLVEDFGPELIVNAAAYTDVEGAEDDLTGAIKTNENGARHLADLANHHQIPIVYFSTDYVFDGKKTEPYEPDDPTAPLGVYGKSKAAGESAVKKSNPLHYIIRTAWLYGRGGNHFVEKILKAAKERPELRVVDDEIGSPTFTLDLAEATYYLARTKNFGVYHAVNNGHCSRYDFARNILQLAEIDIPIKPCSSEEFPMKAERPAWSVLSPKKLETVTGHTMRTWREALLDYMVKREEKA